MCWKSGQLKAVSMGWICLKKNPHLIEVGIFITTDDHYRNIGLSQDALRNTSQEQFLKSSTAM